MLQRINKLLEGQWFPLIFRIFTMAAFIALIVIGFSASSMNLKFARQLSFTNLTTSFVWRLWWPLIILSAFFFGRVWCMACPVEMVTTFFAKIGLKRKRPGWLLSGWFITVFYGLVVVLGITILEIDRIPKYTSIYLLIIIVIAVISGLLFEKNTFCRYICPVGYMLGLFSKLAAWGWRVKNVQTCKTCPDKSCISSDYRYNLNYKSCGVDLVPSNIDSNSYCILCSGCMKTCKAYRTENNSDRPNPALVKTGFASDLLKAAPLLIAEWMFLFFLAAHLVDEISEFRLIGDFCTSLMPGKITGFSGMPPGMLKNIISSGILFVLFPAILWITPYLVLTTNKTRISLADYLRNFSLAVIPVLAGILTGLIIMEIVIRVPYYKFMIHDVRGIDSIRSIITRQAEVAQIPLWAEWCMLVALAIASVLGIIVSLKVIKKLKSRLDTGNASLPQWNTMPVVFLVLFYIEVIIYRCF